MQRASRHSSRNHNYDLRRRVLINNFIRTQTQMWMQQQQQYFYTQSNGNSNGNYSERLHKQLEASSSNEARLSPSLAASVCSDGRTPFMWSSEHGTNFEQVNTEVEEKENTVLEKEEGEVSINRPVPKSPDKKRRRSSSSLVGGVFRALSRRLRSTESSQLRQQVKARSTRSVTRSRHDMALKERRANSVVTVPSLYSSEEPIQTRSSASFVRPPATHGKDRKARSAANHSFIHSSCDGVNYPSQIRKRSFLKIRKPSTACVKANRGKASGVSEKSCRIKRVTSPVKRRSSLRRALDRLVFSPSSESSLQPQAKVSSSRPSVNKSPRTSVSGTSFFARLFGNGRNSTKVVPELKAEDSSISNDFSTNNGTVGRVATVVRSRSLQERTQSVTLPRRRKSICVRIPEIKVTN